MIEQKIAEAINLVDDEEVKSRELALVKTKLEEAELWLEAARTADTRQQRRHAARQAAKAREAK